MSSLLLPDTSTHVRRRSLAAFEVVCQENDDDVKAVFDVFDTDADGKVTVNDLTEILQEILGDSLDAEEVEDLLNKAGVDTGVDEISFEQFQRMMADDGTMSPAEIRRTPNGTFPRTPTKVAVIAEQALEEEDQAEVVSDFTADLVASPRSVVAQAEAGDENDVAGSNPVAGVVGEDAEAAELVRVVQEFTEVHTTARIQTIYIALYTTYIHTP